MSPQVRDVERLRPFVSSDPLRNAVMIQRLFMPRGRCIAFADDEEDPKAVAVVDLPDTEGDSYSLTLHGVDPRKTDGVLRMIPEGAYWIQLADEQLFPVLGERMRMGWYASAWLLAMDPEDLKGDAGIETRRIDGRWAHKIAAVWATDWNADGYVRHRLEEGPSSGVFVDGELVGWGATHFETDKVSMLGFMYILPEHRNRGYAESITADLVRQAAAAGRTPACHVYEENYQSLGLCERMGFRRVCRQIWGDAVTRQ